MARPANLPALNGSQALYILGKLIDERSVSAADIRRHLAGMWQEMSVLEKRIAELRGVMGSMHPVRSAKQVVKRVVARAKRTAKTPEAAASRKLQGQYIAAIRQIPKTKRAFYQKISKAKGREAAIAAMKKATAK